MNISVGLPMTYLRQHCHEQRHIDHIRSVFKPRKPRHDSQRTDFLRKPWNNSLFMFHLNKERNNLTSHMNKQAPASTDSFRATARNRKKVGPRQPFGSFSFTFDRQDQLQAKQLCYIRQSTRDMFGVSTKILHCY